MTILNTLQETYCFADDRKDFWENFNKRNEDNFVGIYNYNDTCILPDLDTCCYTLYIYHQFLWNKQCMAFKNSGRLKNIPWVKPYSNGLGLTIEKKGINLGSDSFISIGWHYERLKDILNDVKEKRKEDINNTNKELDKMSPELKERRKYDENFSLWKKFIWLYLQKSNTIGGFIVFPRNKISINGQRGLNVQINDRFDLTLECIKKYYNQEKENNPLYDVLDHNSAFFNMFGKKGKGFKNYIDFFFLQDWVDNNYKVRNLLNNEPLDEYSFSENNPLPNDYSEWWSFYKNLMDRLDKRNTRIKSSI